MSDKSGTLLKNCLQVKLNESILVLNATYEPISLTTGRRARVLVLKNKAYVVSSRTVRLKVVVKIPYSKNQFDKPTRGLILKRDRHTCQYCGYSGDKMTVDHLLPRSRGGKDSYNNLVASCLPCNNSKDDRTPEEWASSLKQIFNRETTNVSALPFSWDAFQIGMLEHRVRATGTVLASKPKAPFNKITVTISTSGVEEWRDYLYS